MPKDFINLDSQTATDIFFNGERVYEIYINDSSSISLDWAYQYPRPGYWRISTETGSEQHIQLAEGSQTERKELILSHDSLYKNYNGNQLISYKGVKSISVTSKTPSWIYSGCDPVFTINGVDFPFGKATADGETISKTFSDYATSLTCYSTPNWKQSSSSWGYNYYYTITYEIGVFVFI